MHQPASRSSDPQQRVFNTLAATLAHRVERDEPSFRPPTHRDAHPKHHGCVSGTFTVEADLAPPLRRGVCQQPGKSFEVWIRFSNAFARNHDLTWDPRGMAIKLLNVGAPHVSLDGDPDPGGQRTQDFLLVTHHSFFARTAADFVDFPAAVSGASSFAGIATGVLSYFLGGWPWRWRLRGLISLLRSFRWIESPLGVSYFSQVPFRLGEHRVKLCVRPRTPARNLRNPRFLLKVLSYLGLSIFSFGRLQLPRWANLLHTALLAELREREARFDFMVQLGTETMPVDDAVVAWDDRASPYVKVATIAIHRLPDDFKRDEMMRFGEHLSFTPWHALADHEPLGSINAARRHVYERISSLRHALNRQQRREPRTGETPAEYLRSIAEP